MKHIIIILALFAFACSESPTETSLPTDMQSALYNPPPPGGRLDGVWRDSWGATLSQSGLYDPNIPAHFATDLRVQGNWVWFKAQGGGHQRIYSGLIDGDTMVGYEELSNWTPSQGVVYTFPPKPFNFTRK